MNDKVVSQLMRSGGVLSGSELSSETLELVASDLKSEPLRPVALYIHLPFTPALDFSCHKLAVVTHRESDLTDYTRLLTSEIKLVTANFSTNPRVHRLVIGGPCPNYLSDLNFAELLNTLACSFDFADDAPITVHIDPRRSSRVQLELLRGLGVTEINLEVRDVDPRVQAAIGMTQSIGLIEDTISMARNLGFKSVNMDLTFGLPLQTAQSIQETVNTINELSPDVISCQQFIRRPELFPHQRGMDSYGDLSLAEKLSMFYRVAEGFRALDWEWVGLNSFVRSNHSWVGQAQPDSTGFGPHGYFIGQNETTLGFGVGAVTETRNLLAHNILNITDWKAHLESKVPPYEAIKVMTAGEKRDRSDLNTLFAKKAVPNGSSALALLSDLGFPDYCFESCDSGANVQISDAGRHWLPFVWPVNGPSVAKNGFL